MLLGPLKAVEPDGKAAQITTDAMYRHQRCVVHAWALETWKWPCGILPADRVMVLKLPKADMVWCEIKSVQWLAPSRASTVSGTQCVLMSDTWLVSGSAAIAVAPWVTKKR